MSVEIKHDRKSLDYKLEMYFSSFPSKTLHFDFHLSSVFIIRAQ